MSNPFQFSPPKGKRRIRRPAHRFQIRTRPWIIQPHTLAPVLPGETMRNLLLQVRTVTDPIDNPLIGWWHEHYYFYVKLRDLDDRATFESMVLDPEYSTSGLNEAASTDYFHGWSTINYSKKCLKRVVEEYFRVEGESWDTYTISSMPIAGLNLENGLDSCVSDTNYLANQSEEETLTVGGDDSFTATEMHDLMTKYYWQREHGLIRPELTYEAWLEAHYGVKVPVADNVEDLYKPELIRFVRNWSYPTNTIDPSSGTPRSAVSWTLNERGDKDRFFSEPGFIFGCTVTRPKVYLSKQVGSLAGLMTDAKSWLPGLMLESDPFLGFKKTAATSGVIPTSTDAYWIDIKDLLEYGDQFLNFALTATDAGLVALPTTALQKRYAASTDADNLFVTKTAGTGKVKMDGVTTFMIATHSRDLTATI